MNPLTEPDIDHLLDTIRRTIRVLGSQPAHVSNPQGTRSAARLIHGRLARAGVPVRWFDGAHGTPLLIAGSGPVAISTYIDDSHPAASDHAGIPPALAKGVVNAPGIERKAGVLAAVALLLSNPQLAEDLTVLVETDRHAGSHTMQQWFEEENPSFLAIAWEVSDLPVIAPVAILAATGSLIVEIRMLSPRRGVESVYGTALPDLGIAIAGLLASLKSTDDEVRLAGFYDGIGTPAEDELASLLEIAPGVSRWLARVAVQERELSTTHMTLGMFCAPSITVRSISMSSDEDYLPNSATAVIELQLLPGQSVSDILAALDDHVGSSPFQTEVRPLLARPPVGRSAQITLPPGMKVVPIAPGPTPASIFDLRSIQTIGYAAVPRDPDREADGLTITSVEQASQFLLSLCSILAEQTRTS